jgi:hypothetical protein
MQNLQIEGSDEALGDFVHEDIMDDGGRHLPRDSLFHQTSAHQRKSFWVKRLVGASSVVCPCMAVMGMVPSSV